MARHGVEGKEGGAASAGRFVAYQSGVRESPSSSSIFPICNLRAQVGKDRKVWGWGGGVGGNMQMRLDYYNLPL